MKWHAARGRERRRPTAATAVVVGLHQNGLGVARALGRQGVAVVAVDGPQDDAYGVTRYARRVACPDLRGHGLIDTLVDIGRTLDQKGVLILTLDRSVLLVSEHRAEIEPYFVHSLPDDAVVQQLMNKTTTEAFARAQGFHVPRTYSVHDERDLDRCLEDIDLPCILKPEVKTVEFVERSPKKAFFVRTRDELRELWHMVTQWEPGVVVQEWIPGPDTQLVFCLYYFDREGQPLAAFGGRKLRQFIPHCGTACAAEPWDDATAMSEGLRFFRAAGYRGFGAIEFKNIDLYSTGATNYFDDLSVLGLGGTPPYTCTITGTCPGTVRLEWSGAEPNRQQGILFARNTGNFTIQNGTCAGTQLGLGTNQLQLYNTIGTGSGAGSVNAQAGPGACDGFVQLIQVPGCITSNVAQVP